METARHAKKFDFALFLLVCNIHGSLWIGFLHSFIWLECLFGLYFSYISEHSYAAFSTDFRKQVRNLAFNFHCHYNLRLQTKQSENNLFTTAHHLDKLFISLLRFGRKVMLFGAHLIAGTACLATTLIPDGKFEHNWPIVVLCWIGNTGCFVAFSSSYTVTKELFPTPLR